MNICVFYLLIFSCSVLVLRSYGRKWHFEKSFSDYESENLNGVDKLKVKKMQNIYPKVENLLTKSKHLSGIKEVGPKKVQSNHVYDQKVIPVLEGNNLDEQKSQVDDNKNKIVSNKIRKHLVKITSALLPKSLDVKQDQNAGQEIQLNPKFSHVIEIIPINETEQTLENPESAQLLKSKTDAQPTEAQKLNLKSDITSLKYNARKDTIITSKLEYNDLELNQLKEGGFELSLVPKFQHTIEISEREGDDVIRKYKPNLLPNTENEVGTKESLVTENVVDTKEIKIENFFDSDSTQNVLDLDSSVKVENGFDFDESVKSENAFEANELITPENAFNAEDNFEFDGNQQSFDTELEGSGEHSFRSDISEDEVSEKNGRFIFSPQNASAPNCTTPKGELGQCRRIRQCLLSDVLNNFNVFLEHLCLIRGALIGVCCPNNPVIEISNTEENATENITQLDIQQPPEGCGFNTKTRIVGGSISVPHEWTWMVALLRRNRFYCGGVIVNNWYILTAAHCVMGINVKDLTVRLGEYDFNTHNKHQQDISVSEIKRHAKFVTLTFQHDIALLKLKKNVQYSKFVGSICLPNQKARDYSDVNGTVVGWGTVSFGGAASPILRQVTIPVWKNEDCDRAYLLENINDSFMCAGSPEKGEDACQGDSGGPLMSLNDKGRWEVIGIVSWGRRCGDPSYPGVYTRVTTYLDWIAENAN